MSSESHHHSHSMREHNLLEIMEALQEALGGFVGALDRWDGSWGAGASICLGCAVKRVRSDRAALVATTRQLEVLGSWASTIAGATSALKGAFEADERVRLGEKSTELAAGYEQRRAERLASREDTAPVVEMGRRCVRCEKKPARIDDYCKKCAREVGIVVRGKIGEE